MPFGHARRAGAMDGPGNGSGSAAKPKGLVGGLAPASSQARTRRISAARLLGVRGVRRAHRDILEATYDQGQIDVLVRVSRADLSQYAGFQRSRARPVYDTDLDVEESALAVIEDAFPDRYVVPVVSDSIAFDGGTIHCITRTLPRVEI